MKPAVQTSVPSQKFWIHQRARGRQGEEEEILTGTESKQTDTDTHTHTHTQTHTHTDTHTDMVTDTKRISREQDRKRKIPHLKREI